MKLKRRLMGQRMFSCEVGICYLPFAHERAATTGYLLARRSFRVRSSVRSNTQYRRLRQRQTRPVIWVDLSLVLAVAVGIRFEQTAEATAPAATKPTATQVSDASPIQTTNTATNQQVAVPVPLLQSNSPAPPSTAFLLASNHVLEAQIALARQGISPGPIDGIFGPQTRAAFHAFQEKENLAAGGELDTATRAQLGEAISSLTNYVVTAEDLARLQPLGDTWLAKSKQSRLDHETILELIAEKSWSHPNLIRRLNPAVDWSNVVAGATLVVPNVEPPLLRQKAAFLRISLFARILQVFDAQTNLLAHFPCSIAQRVEKRPVGTLRVTLIARNPNYTFDPENFPESAEAQQLGRRLILPPGPNNPVGTVWIGLDKPGYGIHGTPRPELVGRTESHGCFRLANWNAELLAQFLSIGTPVEVEP